MRTVILLLTLIFSVVESGGIKKQRPNLSPALRVVNERIDFDRQLKPIFESKCMPCHFKGGQVYERLPFDKPETIRKLGTKLFTRIKDEDKRQLIREFLAQSP